MNFCCEFPFVRLDVSGLRSSPVSSGPVRLLPDLSGPFWNSPVLSRIFRHISEPDRTRRNLMEHGGTSWNTMEGHVTGWKVTEGAGTLVCLLLFGHFLYVYKTALLYILTSDLSWLTTALYTSPLSTSCVVCLWDLVFCAYRNNGDRSD